MTHLWLHFPVLQEYYAANFMDKLIINRYANHL